jgi:hypothetical protein
MTQDWIATKRELHSGPEPEWLTLAFVCQFVTLVYDNNCKNAQAKGKLK